MKNRNILYGYRRENGSIIIDPEESKIFLEMTVMYLNGHSLKGIADTMNARQIIYWSGMTGWNKSRVMRLIFDERYTGSGKYPKLIDRSTYDQLIQRRNDNSCLMETDLSSDLYRLNIPVICPACGSQMKRRVFDSTKEDRQCWICSSCRKKVFIPDEEFITAIVNQLNTYIASPAIISEGIKPELRVGADIASLEREFTAMLERPDLDKDSALRKTRELAAMRYQAIDNRYYISAQLVSEFEKAEPLREFSSDLAVRTIKEIRLDGNANIRIVLKNGHIFTEGE